MTLVTPREAIRLPSLRPHRAPQSEPTMDAQDDRIAPSAKDLRKEASGLAKTRVTAEVLAELALLLVAVSASLSVTRLIEGGLGSGVVLRVLACVLGGGIVAMVASRRGLRIPEIAALGIVATALICLWVIVPGATRFGVPTVTTVRVLVNEVNQARSVMGIHRTPVPAVPGVVFIAAIASGALCVAARVLWEISKRHQKRWPRMIALLPSFGMVCYSAPLSARVDRPEIALGFLVCALFFVAASDAGTRTLRPTGRRNKARAFFSTTAPGIATSLVAVVVLLLAAATLAGTVPLAFPWWNSGRPGIGGTNGVGGSGPITSLSLIANLQREELKEGNVQILKATAPSPTYWQVGLLTKFDGTTWLPGTDENDAWNGAITGVPAAPALPGFTNTFDVSVAFQDFSSSLLAGPPVHLLGMTASSLLQNVQLADGLGAAVTTPAGPKNSYQLIAAVPPALPTGAGGPATLADIYAGLGASKSTYLSLPKDLPSVIRTIARAAIGGATTPLEKVDALVKFFGLANGFFYTLNPPRIPAGENPLVAFLTNSKYGYCQQFAGAFGVLARELGIPVRLGAGFTAGTLVPHTKNTYEVTGADAHVWPEVYLGANYGWVSVDPTPGPALGQATPSSVITAGSLPASSKDDNSGDTLCGPKIKLTACSIPKKGTTTTTLPVAIRTIPAVKATTAPKSSPHPAGLIVGIIAVVVVLLGGLFFFQRSRRSVRNPFKKIARPKGDLSDADFVVLNAWQRASDALGRAGFQRSVWVTPKAHAEAVRDAVQEQSVRVVSGSRKKLKIEDVSAALGAATYGYAELAELAELACYCPGRCTSRDARHCEQEAWRIERALRTAGLLRRVPAPPPAARVSQTEHAGIAGRS